MNKLFFVYLFLFIPVLCLSQTIEDKVIEIGNELMCPVCQGQSVAESNSNLAQDMRSIIKNKLKNGESKEEIIYYFVSRYGDSILGAPPAKGINYLLWLLPIISLSIGAFIILKSIRSFKKPNEEATYSKSAPNPEHLKKVERELEDNP